MKSRGLVWFGALCVILAIVAVIGFVAAFDRAERDRIVTTVASTWTDHADGQSRHSLGRFTLPRPGVLRIVVCPTPLADPHAILVVAPARAATAVFTGSVASLPGMERLPLTADESRGKRCFDGSFRTDRAGEYLADVIVRAPSAGAIARVETMASRRITPRAMWPVLLMIAGFLIVMLAPRDPRFTGTLDAIATAPDSVPEAYRVQPMEPAPEMPLGGIVPEEMLVPGRPYVPGPFGGPDSPGTPVADEQPLVPLPSGPDAFVDFILGRPAPIRWRFSSILAVIVYAVLLVGAPILVTIVAAITQRGSGSHLHENGTFIVALVLVQHGALIAAGFWFMGAIAAPDRRQALGLLPARPLEMLRAVGLAFALVSIAAFTTHFIKDVSVTPMGQLVERVPIRYAIAFGALLAPFSEELFFRGVLYGAFAKRFASVGVVASAVIFTASHALQLSGAAIGLIPIACVGLVNGMLRAKTGGITQSWMVHTVYNLTLSAGLYFL